MTRVMVIGGLMVVYCFIYIISDCEKVSEITFRTILTGKCFL